MTSPAAKYLGVGLGRPSRGQTCCGMLSVMARIVPARPASTPNGSATIFSRDRSVFLNSAPRNLKGIEEDEDEEEEEEEEEEGGGVARAPGRQQTTKFPFALGHELY